MKNLILKFPSIADVAQFSKLLQSGYTINTTTCTITGNFTSEEISTAKNNYKAVEPETLELSENNQEASFIESTSQAFYYN